MGTDRRVPPSTYVIAGTLVIGMVLPILLFADGGREAPEPFPDPFPEFGTGYEYQPETLLRFRKLLRSPDWTLAVPPRNPQGMLEAVHGNPRALLTIVRHSVWE